MSIVSLNTLSLSSIIRNIAANNILIRDTLVGSYAETEQAIDRVTLAGAYSEAEVHQLDTTLVGMYVETQEDEKIYETVVLPQGIGAKYQNVPLITITRR
jgi:hypothetical protein